MEIENLLHYHSREELREWLKSNSHKEKCCWIVVSMNPASDAIFYLDSVEEALCFGWIDGIKKKISENHLAQRLSPRVKGSKWTELNKERVRRLERCGLMTDAGRNCLPQMDIESFVIHEDILQAIEQDEKVSAHFSSFNPLYCRVRIDNIQKYRNEPKLFQSRLAKFIENTRAGKMYGNWHDDGRLL